VNVAKTPIARRSFLKGALPCLALTVSLSTRTQTIIERGKFGEDDLGPARAQLLDLVNAERSLAALAPLELDELACRVADQHALDMAKGEFLSHWGSDGLKPYHRYSFAGGSDAIQENVSQAENIASVTPKGVNGDLRDMHMLMHAETPPRDGHRRAILASQHTHVGFGIALKGSSLKLAELYVARYLEVKPVARQAPRNSTVVLSGHLLNAKHFLHEVDIYYEPLPTRPDESWLRTARPYALPDEYVALRPKAPGGATYSDGTTGDYEWSRNGKFRVPAKLHKDTPGIYTIVFWIRRVPADIAFPAAEICIRCE
jgi:uncharacterized protein YkwD